MALSMVLSAVCGVIAGALVYAVHYALTSGHLPGGDLAFVVTRLVFLTAPLVALSQFVAASSPWHEWFSRRTPARLALSVIAALLSMAAWSIGLPGGTPLDFVRMMFTGPGAWVAAPAVTEAVVSTLFLRVLRPQR